MKQRIAVLGSGPGAMGAVWEITQSPNWQDIYEIDFYVMGWRLGGKTASGRDPKNRYRNEEHGLHILGGFYHNCFQQLTPLYEQWNLKHENCPLHFDEAFFKHNSFSVLQDEPQGPYRETRFTLDGDSRLPGVDPVEVTIPAVIAHLWEWVSDGLKDISAGKSPQSLSKVNRSPHTSSQPITLAARPSANKVSAAMVTKISHVADDMLIAAKAVKTANVAVELTDAQVEELLAPSQEVMSWLGSNKSTFSSIENGDWLGIALLSLTIAKGLIKDRVLERGFDSINQYDAREWLKRHGAGDRVLRNGNFQAGYNYAFAFTDGDPERRDFAAGSALRAYFRLLFASHGNIFYHMNGGMGEIYALPFYDVLKDRGVRFHFFHKVTSLEPDDNGNLAHVNFQVQAESKNGEYDPIIRYKPSQSAKERRCWPSQPLWDQLHYGDELEKEGVDLESMYGPVPLGSKEKKIEVGVDFDLCILAIPSGALKVIAQPLAAVSPMWREMLDSTGTSPTLAAQSWRRTAVSSFGGFSTCELMTAYNLPLDTWADMSFLLKFEQNAPSSAPPVSLSYFCGAVPTPTICDIERLPESERIRSAELTEAWMVENLVNAFPGLAIPGQPYDKTDELERITVLNSDPAKLYVTSPKGTISKRLRPDQSGFANLFLAGDWTRHNFDVGAVESAVISARFCSRAICGFPETIYGESDFV